MVKLELGLFKSNLQSSSQIIFSIAQLQFYLPWIEIKFPDLVKVAVCYHGHQWVFIFGSCDAAVFLYFPTSQP